MTPDRPEADAVVIVGAEKDIHVAAVRDAVAARGVRAVLFDSLAFPERHRLSLGEAPEEILLDGEPLGRPAAVYLRSLYLSPLAYLVDVSEAMQENWRRTMIVFREKGELLLGLMARWERLGVPIYNPPSASEATRKPYQLASLARAGLPVPRTLWTNDPESLKRFAEGRRVIFKPVAGGAATRELKLDELDEERLARLANAPVTFQELLPGVNLRVFVLDGEVVAAFRIESETLDYRQNEESITAFEPDERLVRICREAARAVGLRFTGMDLKEDERGEPRILELNPSPMFLGFDQHAGTDVLGALAGALARHAGG